LRVNFFFPVFLHTGVLAQSGDWHFAWTKNTDVSNYTARKKINHNGAHRRTKNTAKRGFFFEVRAFAGKLFLLCFSPYRLF
jgi:hypothetical protein